MTTITYYAIGDALYCVTRDAERTVLECLTPPDDGEALELPEPETITEEE